MEAQEQRKNDIVTLLKKQTIGIQKYKDYQMLQEYEPIIVEIVRRVVKELKK